MQNGMAHQSPLCMWCRACRGLDSEPAPTRIFPSQHFENSPTVNALNGACRFPPTRQRQGRLAHVHTAKPPCVTSWDQVPSLAQHLSSTVGQKWNFDNRADLGMGVHLWPGVPAGAATLAEATLSSRAFPGTRARPVRSATSSTRSQCHWHVIGTTAALRSFPRYYNLAGSPLPQTTSTVELNVNGQVQRASTSSHHRGRAWATITSTVSLVSGQLDQIGQHTPNSFALASTPWRSVRRVRRPPLLHRPDRSEAGSRFDTDTYNDSRSARLDNRIHLPSRHPTS